MEFVIQPLESAGAVFSEDIPGLGCNIDCVHNDVRICGCVQNDVAGCACQVKS